MEVKLLEIRDRATFIPVMAIALIERDEAEHYLLRRAGYSEAQIASDQDPVDGRTFESGRARYIVLVKLDGVEAQYDPWSWPTRARTMPAAHNWIIENWQTLKSGSVVDVEHILGERAEPKMSERLTAPF